MYGYAGASAAASTVTPFSQPPATTDPAGLARQGAANRPRQPAPRPATQAQEIISNGYQLISDTPQSTAGAHRLDDLPVQLVSTSANTALTSMSSYMSKLNTLAGPAKYAMYPMNFLNKGLTMSKAATTPVKAAGGGIGPGARD